MVKIIALDGPASVGKSTLAKKISIELNYPLLISGKLYRAVAYEVLINKINLNDKNKILQCIKKIDLDELESNNLYSSKIDMLSSIISRKKYVRNELIKYQRHFPIKYGKGKKIVIIEGRDIATVIFPEAEFKIFLWADAQVRAERRYLQIRKNGKKANLKRIYEEINKRDKADLNRKVAPLRPHSNSVLLDTTYLDIEQSFNSVIKILNI